METIRLFIKNMVCNRCIMVVQDEMDKLGLNVKNIKLGEVTLDREPSDDEKKSLEKALTMSGFELMDDKKSRIAQKIEKVKELLVYDELSLSEIAFRLNYSSVAYLSNQFKKVTGLTPSHFKQIREDKRKPLDKV